MTNIARLLDAARRVGTPIVHVVHRGLAGGLFDPAIGGVIASEATPQADELIVEKTLPNSFAGTALHEELEARGARELVMRVTSGPKRSTPPALQRSLTALPS